MKTSRALLLTLFTFTLLAPLGWATPASAGTVYVPLATNSDIAGSRFRTAVWVVNTGAVTASVQAVFLASEADGRTRTSSTPSLSLQAAPGATALITPTAPDGRTGMLEITGPNSLVVEARLSNGGLGAPLQVVSSSNLLPAGATAHLLALERDRERFTNIGLLNLGQAAARCTARVMQSDGRALGADVQITLPPLSHRQYNDPLPAFGATALTSGRTSITCDRPFFAYSATFRQGGAEVSFGGPSQALDSALTAAGADLAEEQVGRIGYVNVRGPKRNHHVELVVRDAQGRQLLRATDNTTFTRRIFTTRYQYLIDFGLHDEAADAPTIGWKYADLKVEFFQ
jgi:hypothetical protein